MQNETRRTFIKKTGAVSAFASGGLLNLNPNALGANERVTLAVVGLQNRGMQVTNDALRQGAVIKTICDVDDAILEKRGAEITRIQKKKPEYVKEFRRVLDDADIEGVVIATPDHWHAIQTIQACQAGKDVYVEKPLSHTIHEGLQMIKAARKHDRIVQIGTQRRSAPHFDHATDYVASGKLGSICLAKAWMCQVRGDLGNPPDSAVPPGVDYDTWLGPAPKRPFNKLRFHYNWRFFWDYCNSEQGNQGVHMIDIAMWAIAKMRGGIDNILPSKISGHGGIYWLDDCKEVPDTQVVTYDFGDLMFVWELRSFQSYHPLENTTAGIAFYGTEGTLIVNSKGWKVYLPDGKEGPSGEGTGGSHAKSFMECMKSRKRPVADVEVGYLSTTMCHLGNITYKLGRDVHFDPKSMSFADDKEANQLLSKSYRAPYLLPKV